MSASLPRARARDNTLALPRALAMLASMPRANVDVVQRVYAAFAQRDPAAVLALFAEDAEIVQSTEVSWGGRFRGHEQITRFFAGLTARVATNVTIERAIDAGEHGVVIGRTRGTVLATGAPLDVPIAHVWRVRDGKALRAEFYIDNR